MFNKIYNSRYTAIALDVIGVFSLASFILLGFYLRFIVDLLPSCYFTNALIVYVECGNSIIGEILKAYFYLFSPLIVWIIPLLGFGLVMSAASLRVVPFLTTLLFTSIALLAIGTSIRISYKILKRLTWRWAAYGHKDRMIAFMLVAIILLPSIAAMGLKYHIVPSQLSNQEVRVDMWHNEFSMPRHYLHAWSLIDVERPERKPSPFAKIVAQGRKLYPFATVDIAYNQIDPLLDDDEILRISISPHYSVMSNMELYRVREKYLETKQARTSGHGPLYGPMQRMQSWEIYEPLNSAGYEPDIFIHRNVQGQIESILECTPKTHCAERISLSGARMPRCKSAEECEACSRVCDDVSLGTTTLNIRYMFNKKDLDSYFDRHSKIVAFIEDHSTPKAPERFIYNTSNIVSWREADGAVSIQLTEEGQKEFADLTRRNVGKPLETYVGDLLIGSAIVREPIEGGRMFISMDDEKKQEVINLLPADRKEDNGE
ncbi:MAG: hypothetical protein LRY36_00325 [Alphaproteobacteria bacterium]|nr:hypothetical protein [Alphaproteobacteria bacterium]